MSVATIYEGIGQPKILFNDGSTHLLPEPVGPDKDGLRLYDFESFTRDQYWSEGGIRNNIGKKFIFAANLKWVALSRTSLLKLWKAQKEVDFIFLMNIDREDIEYKCEVVDLKYRFFKGISNHRAGYTVDLKLRGVQLLNAPGYSQVQSGDGYGTGWGLKTDNQSP